ncbi:MAG TPA: glycosyltransferase family 4 protein, partial [Terriglobales bacterium]|nr:glycosyltransferase family 4 protein [Terriglobales bacterium]
MNDLHIGIAGPIMIAPLKPYLEPLRASPAPLPQGLGGSPVVNLVLELLRRNRRLTVFSLDPSLDSEVVLQGERLKICLGPYRARHRARDLFAVERDYLLQAMQREKPDIVHAYWTYEFALAALDSGFPVLVTAEDAPLTMLRYNFTPYRALRALMAYRVVRRAAHMTFVSPYLAENYVKTLRYRGRTALIPNALAEEVFSLVGALARTPSAGRLTFASALDGWAGRKNGQALLQAFALVRERLPEARLLMFGQGHGSGEGAELWAKQKRLTTGVQFAGSTPYFRLLQQLREEVDVLVHPSLEESFGMILAECMALGIPVIAGEHGGGTRYVLEEGKAGLLTDVRAPGDLAGAMLRLANPERRKRYSEAGAESVRRRFGADSM